MATKPIHPSNPSDAELHRAYIDDTVNDIARIQRARKEIKVSLEAEIQTLRDQAEELDSALRIEQEKITSIAATYAQENREAIYGKSKSRMAAQASHGFRSSTSLEFSSGWDEYSTIDSLKKSKIVSEKFLVKTKESLDKPGLKKLSAMRLSKHGLGLVTSDTFFITPKKETPEAA